MFYSERKILCAVCISFCVFSGCADWKGRESAEVSENHDDQNVTINMSQTQEAGKDIGGEGDAWGLNDIVELFEMWEWHPSSHPTSMEEIADRAGCTQEYMTEQIGNAEEALLLFS